MACTLSVAIDGLHSKPVRQIRRTRCLAHHRSRLRLQRSGDHVGFSSVLRGTTNRALINVQFDDLLVANATMVVAAVLRAYPKADEPNALASGGIWYARRI